jgi:hypothetical protein
VSDKFETMTKLVREPASHWGHITKNDKFAKLVKQISSLQTQICLTIFKLGTHYYRWSAAKNAAHGKFKFSNETTRVFSHKTIETTMATESQ